MNKSILNFFARLCAVVMFAAALPSLSAYADGDREAGLLGFWWSFDPAKSLSANLADNDGRGGGESWRLTGILGGGAQTVFSRLDIEEKAIDKAEEKILDEYNEAAEEGDTENIILYGLLASGLAYWLCEEKDKC